MVQPPLAFFRELLAMPAPLREERLAKWPAEKRERLRVKITEYQAMTPEAREQSLVATELHWYLQQFLRKPAATPAIELSQVPEPYHKFISDRLTLWTMLPPPLQAQALEHESTRDFFLLGARTATRNSGPPLPPILRAELLRLDGMANDQRRRTYMNFESFFDLTAAEKKAVLETVPSTERQQLESTIAGLDRLTREEREKALLALAQVAGLGRSQQEEFIRNLARWNRLAPEEKEVWIQVTTHFPPMPPLPPPVPPLPPPMPPLPSVTPEASANLPSLSSATNPSR